MSTVDFSDCKPSAGHVVALPGQYLGVSCKKLTNIAGSE